MPSTGAPGNIWFPDDTSPVAPLENLFLTMATSINTALSTSGVPHVADLAALALVSGSLGNARIVDEGGALFIHNGTTFVQRTEAIFATAAARNTAYAKASGAYRVGGARAFLNNVKMTTEYPHVGTAWRGVKASGLTKMIPTVTGSGVTVDDAGTVIIGSGVGNFEILNCFTAEFDYYLVEWGFDTSAGAADLLGRLINGTTPQVSAYGTNTQTSNSTAAVSNVSNGGNNAFIIGRTNGLGGASGRFEVRNPFRTTYSYVESHSIDSANRIASSAFVGGSAALLSLNGIQFIPFTTTLSGGFVRIYGYSN